jgi:2-iminobutanoate/2-iminopropanoate deaminase
VAPARALSQHHEPRLTVPGFANKSELRNWNGGPGMTVVPGIGGVRKETFSFTPADKVPPPVGPFAHATRWGSLVFVTGQMPTDPATGELVAGGVVAQAEQVRRNLEAVLAQFGLTLDDALMVRVYLTSFEDFDVFNTTYTTWFRGPLPSRTCVGVSGLAVGATVEIDLIAGIPETGIPEGSDA